MPDADIRPASSIFRRVLWIVAAVMAGILAATIPSLIRSRSTPRESQTAMGPAVGMPGAPPTTASGLKQRISEMEIRLSAQPDDAAAAVLLGDALLREARATNDPRPASRASEVLKAVLKEDPAQYDALRLLGAVQLSQHRFREALNVARRARDLHPDDAWNYGVMGDALLELGEYDKAFETFDRMMELRPGPTAYARVSYARELRGDLTGALHAMELAATSTPPQDSEAKAWYAAQVGELYLKMNRLEEATRAFKQSAFFFPSYSHAMVGLGKAKVAQGKDDEALAIYLDQLTRTPTLDLAGRIGDLYAKAGQPDKAEHYYQLAEDLAGPASIQTEANLALFLATHDRKLPEAVKIAETVAATRQDIFTEDALAWAYFKTGRLAEAEAASARAMRTGTRDGGLLSRAAQIRASVPKTRG
jgi:tetratricopeptide (TPR) repeat protein